MRHFLLLACLLISASTFAQMVPESWEKDLEKRHPKASAVNWIPGDENYTAQFQEGDRKMKAFYTQEGEWFQTQMEIPISEVPEKVKSGVAKGYTIMAAAKVVSAQAPAGHYILQLSASFDKSGKQIDD